MNIHSDIAVENLQNISRRCFLATVWRSSYPDVSINRNTLNLLGCSGSLALMLAAGSAAKADAATPCYGDFINTAADTTATPTRQADPRYATIDPDSDTVGDLAITKFHCDCPAC